MNPRPSKENAPVNVVENTLTVMTDLSAVLGDEIKLLKKQDIAGIQALLRKKNNLVLSYQSGLKSIAANPELVSKAPASVRERLRAAGINLAEAGDINSKALRGAVNATHRLIQYLISTVREEALPSQGYKDPRNAGIKLGSYSPTCEPLAVRRTA